jgi:pimeloyl-ACP methyl ester carboxylesterase
MRSLHVEYAMRIILRFFLAAAMLAVMVPSASAQTVAVTTQRVIFTLTDGVDIHGDIVGPASVLQAGATIPSATVYLHGFGHGEYIWAFDAVPGYNTATELAKLGRVSVVLDRLNYDRSTHLAGMASSMTAQVDAVHQIVGQLKAGAYKAPTGHPWRVGKVALLGLSAGGAIAESVTWQYPGDVDALVVSGWSDDLFGQSTYVPLSAFAQMIPLCLDPTAPSADPLYPGYQYFGQTPADFQQINFAPGNTDPLVAAAATKMRNPEACGDALTIPDLAFGNLAMVHTIQVPTLLLWGTADAVALPTAPAAQLALYGPNASLIQIPNAGHLLPLEQSAPVFRAQLSTWLQAHGF